MLYFVGYKKDEKWYHADAHTEITLTEGAKEPTLKMIIKETVIGYEGENRIWDESAMLSTDSTTQGTGSCYVFYPQSADDQAQSIQLLKNLRVAFISQDGTLFGTGVLDTEHAIEQAGKVTVPLVCHYENSSVIITNGCHTNCSVL